MDPRTNGIQLSLDQALDQDAPLNLLDREASSHDRAEQAIRFAVRKAIDAELSQAQVVRLAMAAWTEWLVVLRARKG